MLRAEVVGLRVSSCHTAINLIRADSQLNVGGYVFLRPYQQVGVFPLVTTTPLFQAVAHFCSDWSLPLPVLVPESPVC